MIQIFLVLLTAFYGSCFSAVSLAQQVLKDKGNHVFIGCKIYDLEGQIVRSYPGDNCLFQDDGSFVSYDLKNKRLEKFNHQLKKLWSLEIHTHHGIKLTMGGDFLINSSTVRPYGEFKKVRFDEVVLVSQDGKIKKRFSFFDHLSKIVANNPPNYPKKAVKRNWDENLDFTHELTHLASSHEVTETIQKNGNVFAPKGSFLVTLNSAGKGVYVLDDSLTRIVNYKKIPSQIFHDVQPFFESNLIYLSNTAPGEKAHVAVYDVFSSEVIETREQDFLAFFGGGVHVIDRDLLLVTDSNSNKGSKESVDIKKWLSLEERRNISMKKLSRVVFLSRSQGVIKEIHFDFKFIVARFQNLSKFLKTSVPL